MLQFSNSRPAVFGAQLERDELWFDRHPALAFCLSMIFSENRIPPVGSKPEGKLFRIMLLEQNSRSIWKMSASQENRRAGERGSFCIG
jgi:hypothetical protein